MASPDVRHIMRKVATTPAKTRTRSQRSSHLPIDCIARLDISAVIARESGQSRATRRHHVPDGPLPRAMTNSNASILQELERGVEDVAGLLVALGLHPLHPFVPDRFAGDLAPAGEFIR